jgi:hypothetical protein
MAATMFGFTELLVMLLMGGMLPRDAEPLPAETVLLHLPDDCELIVFEDLRGIGEAIDSLLTDLSTQAWIVSNAELREGLDELRQGLRMAETMGGTMLGINPFDDLTAVSLCVRMAPAPSDNPDFLVVLQGNFDTTLAARLGADELDPMTFPNGAPVLGKREDGRIFGLASPRAGELLFGSERYLEPLALPTAPPAVVPAAGSMLARLSELVPHGVTRFGAFEPSPGLRAVVGSEGPVTFAELFAGMNRSMWLSNATVDYFEVVATTPDAHRDYELILSGIGEIAQASPHALRGFAQIVLGTLSPADSELDEPIRSLLSHREDILTMLDDSGLLADIETEFSSDAASMTSTLTVSGDSGGPGAAVLLMMLVGGFASFALTPRYGEESSGGEHWPLQ